MKKLMKKLYSPAVMHTCAFCLSIFGWVYAGKNSFVLFGEPEYKED